MARVLYLLLALVGILFPGVAAGQSAQVVVHLVGEMDRPVAGVLVELRGPALDAPRTLITDVEGRAAFPDLPAGPDFRLRTIHVGYGTAETTPFALAEGEVRRHEIRLHREVVGTDTLRVFASPLRIRRADTEFTTRIDREAIDLLPTPYRASEVVRMAPGARPDEIWGGAALQANAYHLDGLAQTLPGAGGAFVEPSIRWIERIELRGLGSGAEYGNFQGGLINLVTRTGSNTRTGGLRVSGESGGLNASNLERTEIGLETELRREVESEFSGPILRDRLYYFVGGHLLEERRRAQSHIDEEVHFLPWTEDRRELRGFGKMTWEPSFRDRLELSAGFVRRGIDNAGLTGYETPDAAPRLTNPLGYYNLSWDRTIGARQRFEASLAGFHGRHTLESPQGSEVPGASVFTYGYLPVFRFQNPLYEREQRPSTRTLRAMWELDHEIGGIEHRIRVGGELSRGEWQDRLTRTGGMSWRPIGTVFLDPEDPATWGGYGDLIPTEWGGEVDFDARVRNDALFVQSHLTLSPRLSISPGLRFGRWGGGVTGTDVLADSGIEPRIGVTVDPTGGNRLVFKAHWGRFHQGMLAQFFDRSEGAGAFTNRELWYHRGSAPLQPETTYTPAEREAPRFHLQEVFRMNEEGRVDPGYRQPYVDQWVAGIELQPADRIRTEVLYVNRENHRMVGLVDENLLDNYTRYVNVGVHVDQPGGPVPIELGDDPLVLPELWISNDMIRQRLVQGATQGGVPLPPGFTFADTLWLSYEEDFVLRNLDEAERTFHQLQFSVHAGYPTWGASASLVWTRLRGNLNSVTGYEAGTDFEDFQEMGAGPFVRPNEQVNFQGALPGSSELEVKLALHGEVGWETRAGAYLNAARGDRFTPFHTLVSFGGVSYIAEDLGTIEPALLDRVAGQRILVRERGSYRYADRVTLDLRLDRAIPGLDGRVRGTVDLFNVWNAGTATDIFPAADVGQLLLGTFRPQNPNERFGAVRGRVPPRTLRLGLTARF